MAGILSKITIQDLFVHFEVVGVMDSNTAAPI
jgi:hypothetical protein